MAKRTAERITLSVIKADVGSIGGHTAPSRKMLDQMGRLLHGHLGRVFRDVCIVHTGDDIAIIASHDLGEGSQDVQTLAWGCFKAAAEIADDQGLYAAAEDLPVPVPEDAGPGIAEIEFLLDPGRKDRLAETFMVLASDKCGPGVFNLPFYAAFCDPMQNTGLLMNPKMHKGFTATVIDLHDHDAERVIDLPVPERTWDLLTLLRDTDRFALERIRSRYAPDETIVAVSAARPRDITQAYPGKNDPVAIVRTQGMFPAMEEVAQPWTLGHAVSGGCRGSHVMPVMPVPVNTPALGAFCPPMISALAFSMAPDGTFTHAMVDVFAGIAWDNVRAKVQAKAEERRREGPFGHNVISHAELVDTGIADTLERLDEGFGPRRK